MVLFRESGMNFQSGIRILIDQSTDAARLRSRQILTDHAAGRQINRKFYGDRIAALARARRETLRAAPRKCPSWSCTENTSPFLAAWRVPHRSSCHLWRFPAGPRLSPSENHVSMVRGFGHEEIHDAEKFELFQGFLRELGIGKRDAPLKGPGYSRRTYGLKCNFKSREE